MSNVIALGSTVLPGEPNPEIIEDLEGLLERARSGELRALAYTTLGAQNTIGTGWAGSDGSRYPLGAAIGMLFHRYNSALLESAEVEIGE